MESGQLMLKIAFVFWERDFLSLYLETLLILLELFLKCISLYCFVVFCLMITREPNTSIYASESNSRIFF